MRPRRPDPSAPEDGSRRSGRGGRASQAMFATTALGLLAGMATVVAVGNELLLWVVLPVGLPATVAAVAGWRSAAGAGRPWGRAAAVAAGVALVAAVAAGGWWLTAW